MAISRREMLIGGAALSAVGCRTPANATRAEAATVPPASGWQRALDALSPDPSPLPSVGPDDFRARQRRAREQMQTRAVDALVVTPGPNLSYFTGVRWHLSERLFAFVLPRDSEPFFVTPAFEAGRAEERAGADASLRTWQEAEDPFALAAASLSSAKTIALDPLCPLGFAERLTRACAPAVVRSAADITEALRMRKDAKELALMRRANEATLRALRASLGNLEEGLDQETLGERLRAAQAKQGGAGVWVLPLIGASAAFPHGSENPQRLRQGDVVLVDTGCSIGGYQSDLTRTVFFGEPDDDIKRAWDLVKKAQTEALAGVRPGVTAGAIDATARKVITDGGYGPGYSFFTHRTGHGIGLQGHEEPYFVEGSERVLEPGMTLSCEPGIYVPGRFGIRLEDILVVTDDGAELLGPAQTRPSPAGV
jgi:Xaa-Pro dipeptidase